MDVSSLENEWSLLQNQFDGYEKYSLLIKLFSTSILSIAYFTHQLHLFVFFLLIVLWLQDGIWKTFQSRIETRLLQLEEYLSGETEPAELSGKAYQYNRSYMKCRPSTLKLIQEYFQQSIRPTVAYPHAALCMLLIVQVAF